MTSPRYEPDVMDEVLGEVTRTALATAGRLGDLVMGELQRQQQAARESSEQAAQAFEEKLRSDRDTARVSLAQVHDPQWWDKAQPHEVTGAFETARAWSGLDPVAAQAQQRIATEVKERWGIDLPPREPPTQGTNAQEAGNAGLARGAGPAAAPQETHSPATFGAREHHGVTGTDQQGAESLRSLLGQNSQVGQVPQAAASATQGSATQGGVSYDSPVRRAAMADALGQLDNPAAARARLISDVSNAHSAGKMPRAEPSRASRRQNRAGAMSMLSRLRQNDRDR